MSIPKWRKADCTDDGCSIYECLSCYARWESRTTPGWHYTDRETGELTVQTNWHFCPECGIKWEGEHIWDEETWSEKRHLRYKASGGGPVRDCCFVVQYAYTWFPDNEEVPWSEWKIVHDYEFNGDEAFEEFRYRYYVQDPDNPNVKRWEPPQDIPEKYRCYLDAKKFANLILDRMGKSKADFYRMMEIFKLRLVRQTWKGPHVTEEKVLWESGELRPPQKEHWTERI